MDIVEPRGRSSRSALNNASQKVDDPVRRSIAPERPSILADGDGGNDARGGDRALREEPQIRRGRDQNSWRTETSPCDAEPGASRSADHGAARLRKAGRNPDAH